MNDGSCTQTFTSTERTTLRRLPDRAVYDRETIYGILDEALICHVGIVGDGQPFVMPMLHARLEDQLFLHGSPASRLIRQLASGTPACITATLVDGLVLARSAFHQSMNYRSVVILAPGWEVSGRDEKMTVLHSLMNRLIPRRWETIRRPSEPELDGTAVIGFRIDECSAKVRTGPPKGDERDHDFPIWAGVIPLRMTTGEPVPDPKLMAGVPVPEHVLRLTRPTA